ncbi:hypothetical protein V2594_06615, partial [Tenacibaculum maritimum]
LDIRSVDFVHGASPIFLNGGVSNQYTNIDLSSYFEPNNLIGITPRQYQKSLPEGVYTFCWEVYDAFTNEQLNHPTLGCSNIYLLLNDPPFLNVPYKGDQVVAQDPMNIIFQWTPRHANASNVSYEFELRELWDTQIAPEAAFLTSPNYYTETTATTTLLYHIGKPALLPNKRYGWRVRAVSRTGLSKHSVFKNDGYSEIYYFTYNTACYPPRYVLSEAVGKAGVQIRWQGMPEHKRYHVQYKRADIPDAEWFEVYTYNTQVQISNLRAGKTYVFRVGGSCNELNDFNPLYAYSAINEFSLPAKNEKSSSYTCGIVPEIEISNTQPLQNIGINETFTAGDFPVTIKQVSGSNGRFRGVGYIVVPYLGDTKLAVSFTNIRINTDYQLIEGVVSTTYDATWGDVESVDEFIDGLGDLIDEIEETVNTLFENGEITSEEKEDALGQLNEATTNLQGAAEQQNQADEKKQQAEKAESPEKEKLQEEAEKLEKESKETQQEVNKALNELQNKFGVKGKDGGLEIKTDAFFDGVISYGKGKNVITHKRLDGNGEISINRTDSNNNIPDTSDYNFTHNGKQYNVIVTHSNSTIEAINDAKDKAVNPSTGIVIYFHYDLEKENLGYTVNFAPDYFDNLPNQDFLEVQELHKEALSNLLKQLQSSEDIINVIYNNVLEINTLFQESLNKIQLPETIWNPDAENYTNNDFHFEPLEAGLIDGAIEEIKSIPLLISLVVDYSTNPKTREKINKAFSDFDFTNAMNKWYESRKDLYTSGTIHKIEYRTGKDVVEVGTLIGTGGLATLGKIKKGADLVEGVTSAIKKVAKEGGDLIKRLDELNLSVLTKKLDDLGDATKAKFFDDFADASDDALIALNNKTDLINYWKTNGNFFKNKTYSGSNVDWATTKNAIESGTNNTNKAILEAIEDRVLIEPLTGSKPVMAGAYCPELGGDVIVKYNLTTAEKVTFNYNNLEPVIKDQIDYMNLIRQDALDGGNLYEKLYTGVTKNKIIAAGDAASHAEVLALDALIKEMKIAGIYSSKADLSKISVLVKGKGSWGNMCRCPHCFHLTDGVNMIGH